VFAIDRAGLVGSDGETHQGIFDLTYLSGIPNMHLLAPKNKWELADMLSFAMNFNGPIAIRYPRGTAYTGLEEHRAPIELGKAEWIYRESDVALFAVGSMVEEAVKVRELLKAQGKKASIVNARFIKPFDEETLLDAAKDHSLIVTMEENVFTGGFGEKVLETANRRRLTNQILNIALPDSYVEHGNVELLKQHLGIDPEGIVQKILEAL
ncbi:MAG: 1-deoxy-D-xylulose-5-phosphate synthase, partial [Lachnospiraceae bacterium]|nr:1-deoxy-D-xylulose-5-phosphate synthase [Lachnospiraceae bacterium]